MINSAPHKSLDQGVRGDEHKKYYYTWVVSLESKWGAYSRLLLMARELERWYHEHQQGITKGHYKCKVQTQLEE